MTWKDSNYSSTDVMSMQRDAMRRVQEMQRIANNRINGPREIKATENNDSPFAAPSENRGTRNHAEMQKKISSAPKKESISTETPKKESQGGILDGLLSQLNLDRDRLILLLLLVVLINEGADQKLLLALCYLLL